jgi:hypothetical protein
MTTSAGMLIISLAASSFAQVANTEHLPRIERAAKPSIRGLEGDNPRVRMTAAAWYWYLDSLESVGVAKKAPCPPQPPIPPFRLPPASRAHTPEEKSLVGEQESDQAQRRDCPPPPQPPIPTFQPPIPVFDRLPSRSDAETFRKGLEQWRFRIETGRQQGTIGSVDYMRLQNDYKRGMSMYGSYLTPVRKTDTNRLQKDIK